MNGWVVVRNDIEDDIAAAMRQQISDERGGGHRGIASPTRVGVRENVAQHGDAIRASDDMRPSGGYETPGISTDAIEDAIAQQIWMEVCFGIKVLKACRSVRSSSVSRSACTANDGISGARKVSAVSPIRS